MKRRSLILSMAFASIFGMTGCATRGKPVEQLTIQELIASAQQLNDEYKKLKILYLTTIQNQIFDGSRNLEYKYFFRIIRTKGEKDIYQIYVITRESAYRWPFYESSNDVNGNNLPFLKIDREVDYCSGNKCTYIEHYAISMSKAEMMKYSNSGLKFRTYGSSGATHDIFVPSNYIQAGIRLGEL